MNLRITLLLILLSTLGISGQSQINFAPGLLFRETEKISGTPLLKMEELKFEDPGYYPNSSGKFFQSTTTSPVRFIYIGRVNSCRAGGCDRESETRLSQDFEFFDYFILYDSTARILKVRVFNYEATHGQEITVKKWLSQFIGYNGESDLVVGKNVDAISGATISVYGITEDISAKTNLLKNKLKQNSYSQLQGQIQGTTFTIIFKNTNCRNYSSGIDSIFSLVDTTFSLYNDNSIISKINTNQPDVVLNPLFTDVFFLAQSIMLRTNGAFDITACKGHQYKFQDICIQNKKLIKSDTSIKLDFNAIAQGLTVDMVAEFLELQGIFDYLIEIGGEVRTNGKKPEQSNWVIGIDSPHQKDEHRQIRQEAVVNLNPISMATSGNYRNPGHIINPETGLSVKNEMISVTVFSTHCATADAVATACMVMGLEKTLTFLSQNPEFGAYILYLDQLGKIQNITIKKEI